MRKNYSPAVDLGFLPPVSPWIMACRTGGTGTEMSRVYLVLRDTRGRVCTVIRQVRTCHFQWPLLRVCDSTDEYETKMGKPTHFFIISCVMLAFNIRHVIFLIILLSTLVPFGFYEILTPHIKTTSPTPLEPDQGRIKILNAQFLLV